jgi:hypothetical protein
MLEALSAVPEGFTARGWVTAMAYAPSTGSYQRFDPVLRADRAADGEVRVVTGGEA